MIDDNSSDADREAMQSRFPAFDFYWKYPTERGHARSLNIAIQRIQTARFMFYLEDDWEFLSAAFGATPGEFLADAVTVLNSTRLVQILVNNQLSGWRRQVRALGPTHREIHYYLHEFAVTHPAHIFAYWPGFSLNPAVWDLNKLSRVLEVPSPFNETSDIFEREFAVHVWRQGYEVGYLTDNYCEHIGSNASAYVLNGLPRRFD